jgi:hypothetical protein
MSTLFRFFAVILESGSGIARRKRNNFPMSGMLGMGGMGGQQGK